MTVPVGRIADYLAHMHEIIGLACSFVDGLTKEDLCLIAKRSRRLSSMIVLGEAVSKIATEAPAHSYFEINLDVVW